MIRGEKLDNARRLVEGNRYCFCFLSYAHSAMAMYADRSLSSLSRHDSGDPNTIDLHGTRVSEAITIVKEILAREGASACTFSTGYVAPSLTSSSRLARLPGTPLVLAAAKPLHFVTGRGIHSAGGVPVLGPAVRGALIKDGWDVVESRGGTLSVRGRVSR
jgi:hypothetical protein